MSLRCVINNATIVVENQGLENEGLGTFTVD